MPPAAAAGVATAGKAISGAATAGAGLATIFGGSSSPGPVRLELPPELEESQLTVFSQFLDESQAGIDQTKQLIPFIKQRIDTLDSLAQQATPDPQTIKQLQDLDAQIAQRFGVEIAQDVQAGIITEEAKRQTQELQKQIAAELSAQGKLVDDKLLSDIQTAIRQRVDPGSPEALAINEVRDALLSQVRQEGDVLERDPRVEAELEKSRNQLVSDLANRGIDPNSTAGRRALQEFNQQATETRFSTSEQLATNRLARISQAAQGILSTTDAADLARSRALEQALQVQTVAGANLGRLQQLGQTIQAPIQSLLAANLPEAQRRAEELQRSQLALAASGQAQQVFAGALEAQGKLLQLQQLPLELQSRILETRGAQLKTFESLGAQKFSGNTQQLLREGSVPGFTSRTQPQKRVFLPGQSPQDLAFRGSQSEFLVPAIGPNQGRLPPRQSFRVGPDGRLFLD